MGGVERLQPGLQGRAGQGGAGKEALRKLHKSEKDHRGMSGVRPARGAIQGSAGHGRVLEGKAGGAFPCLRLEYVDAGPYIV